MSDSNESIGNCGGRHVGIPPCVYSLIYFMKLYIVSVIIWCLDHSSLQLLWCNCPLVVGEITNSIDLDFLTSTNINSHKAFTVWWWIVTSVQGIIYVFLIVSSVRNYALRTDYFMLIEGRIDCQHLACEEGWNLEIGFRCSDFFNLSNHVSNLYDCLWTDISSWDCQCSSQVWSCCCSGWVGDWSSDLKFICDFSKA